MNTTRLRRSAALLLLGLAVHLASALTLGDELDGLVAYDERLAAAATALGIRVIAPA